MTNPVAVVGAGAILPGSPGVAQFWRTLVSGRDLMIDVPETRWLIEDHYDADPNAVDKTYGRRGAFLPEVDFDPLRYGIPPTNLSAIDTSQLLALIVADQVLADCVGAPTDPERVGVLIGASSLERIVEASARLQRPVWLRALREHGLADDVARSICDRIAAHYVPWQEETFPGLLTNVVSGRIASRFDLHGVNHTTDAACASSLAALYSGVAELHLGRTDLVITGGVDTMNDVTMYTCFSRTPALSPTGDCRPFAADADGTMLGEGLVLFALKRLGDAERDGDRIYAVVRGVGASSDGRGTAIFAPAPAGQARALRRAYEAAGYGPETVELVEAHGTGTSAGEVAEVAALREVFDASGRADRQWCALGSVKSQIGHTKSTAGAAGLLKAILAVHHKVLPPTIKVEAPHPALDLESSPFYLSTAARPWIRATGSHPRRASVSSFGFGGTNFHVTVEEHPGSSGGRLPAAPTELVLLAAGSVAELRARVDSLVDPGADLTELARRTQAEFDPTAAVRLAVVATDIGDLSAALAHVEGGSASGPGLRAHWASGPVPTGSVGFLFPGQGSQYVGMGADLAAHSDLARARWDAAAGLDLGNRPLHRVVFPPPVFTDAERADQLARLTATEWAQPALAVHSLSLLAVLDAVGLRPDHLAGHSFGELVALHAAGAFDAETLVRLARRRGELMADAPSSGGMLAVAAAVPVVRSAIADIPDVWVANHNAPRQVVLAGTPAALDAVAGRLAADGVGCTRLNTATAFHSPLVAPAREPLAEYLRGLDIAAPALPVIGTAGARGYPADPGAVRERLAAQLAEPVAFVDVVEAMYAAGVRTFVEVGAGATLTGLAGQILGDRPHLAVALDRRGRHGLTSLQEGLGRLAVAGVPLDLRALWAGTATPPAVAVPSKSAVRIDGGNYGRPYPPGPAGPPMPTPAPSAPPPAPPVPPRSSQLQDTSGLNGALTPQLQGTSVDLGWLRVVEDAQRQMAEAHGTFQRTMADSHMAYLRMAESTLAGLLGVAADGAPRPVDGLAPPSPPPVDAPALPAPRRPAEDAVTPMPRPLDVAAIPMPSSLHQSVPGAAGPARAEPAPRSAEGLATLLLSIVADRTGYPVDIINVDMALDTDLGIDSIKKVEILSAVRERIGDGPKGDLSELTAARTLREIAERLSQPSTVDSAAPPTVPAGVPATDAAAPAADLVRRTLRLVVAPASGLALPGLTGGRLVVTDDGRGIGPLVVAELGRHGIAADLVTDVPADADGVIVLAGLRAVESVEGAIEAQRSAVAAARAVAGRMESRGGVFVVVQDTGGRLGLTPGGDTMRAWLGGLVALARTAAKEWPRAAVKAIDCATSGRSSATVAEAIVAELIGGGGAAEVGLPADGSRVVPELGDAPTGSASPRIGPHSVVVVTGGARGVTAAGLRLLARQRRPRLVLIGRTPLAAEDDGLSVATDEAGLIRLLAHHRPGAPAEVAARAREVLAVREIRETLAALERDGVTARYVTVDVSDAGAVSRALVEVRREWGPITAVVHGAGVLADARIGDKTVEQLDRVFDPKVGGLRALLAATADDPLEVLCAFSSVAAVFGNPGQVDYAMANEVLDHVLAAERARRPGCLVRAIAWGPWRGGMVTPALADRFSDAGIPLIDPDAGARAFVSELDGPADEVLAILTARDDSPVPSGIDLVADVVVDARQYPYLSDHRLGGVAVVPVAVVLNWFARAAVAWRPDGRATVIRDLRVLDKIALPHLANGGHRLVLRGHGATAEDGDALDLDLRDDAGRPHYRASVVDAAAPAPVRWSAPSNLEPLIDPYGGTTLFHGPALQALRGRPAVGPDGAHGLVATSPALGWAPGVGDVDIAVVDGALQLALLWARRAGAGDTLPMGVGEIRLRGRDPVDGETRCIVHAVRVDDAGAVCDVGLVDADGTPLIELVGVRLVRRPGS